MIYSDTPGKYSFIFAPFGVARFTSIQQSADKVSFRPCFMIYFEAGGRSDSHARLSVFRDLG